MAFKTIKKWYWQYERSISSMALLSGFIFDAVTLKRVDLTLENVWVGAHLGVAALGLLILNWYDNKRGGKSGFSTDPIYWWIIIIVQFGFGGLLSTFLVFYFRSAALVASWPFLLFLVLAFAFNEIFKEHYKRLTFQTSLLFISIYSFAIYMVPVITHQISDGIFLLSGLISLLLIYLFILALGYISQEKFVKSKMLLQWSIGGIFLVVNLLYFANLIPPLPLSLKDAGVYHNISSVNGVYIAKGEESTWRDFFNFYQVIHITEGEPLYVYSAIFAPNGLSTTVVHQWQRYDESTKKWVNANKIQNTIVGGRDSGFRTYSSYKGLTTGLWRVDVETTTGLLIGRVRIRVVVSPVPAVLVTTKLN